MQDDFIGRIGAEGDQNFVVIDQIDDGTLNDVFRRRIQDGVLSRVQGDADAGLADLGTDAFEGCLVDFRPIECIDRTRTERNQIRADAVESDVIGAVVVDYLLQRLEIVRGHLHQFLRGRIPLHEAADICVWGADVQTGIADGHGYSPFLFFVSCSVSYPFIHHGPMAAMLFIDYYTQSGGEDAIQVFRMECLLFAFCDTVLGIRPTPRNRWPFRRLFGVLGSSFSRRFYLLLAFRYSLLSVWSTPWSLRRLFGIPRPSFSRRTRTLSAVRDGDCDTILGFTGMQPCVDRGSEPIVPIVLFFVVIGFLWNSFI